MSNDFSTMKTTLDYKSGLLLLGIIFFWETVIMITLGALSVNDVVFETIVDATLLTVFSGTSIWHLILRKEKMQTLKNYSNSISFLQQNIDAINKVAIVSVADPMGTIIHVNDNFTKISGYQTAELLGKNHRMLNSGHHSPEFFSELWQTISQGQTWHGIVKNRAKDGQFYWVDCFIIPIFDEKKSIQKYISYRFDVTERIRAEENFEKEKVKNIHLSRLSSLGEMASGIAHEINNPLTVISGSLTGIQRQLISSEDSAARSLMLEKIAKCEFHIGRIVRIIKGLSRLSRESESSEVEKMKVSTLFDNVKTMCAERLKKEGVDFEVTATADEIVCNPIQIEQVLLNLIGNSVDAIRAKESPWVKLRAEAKASDIELSVTDSGDGIPPEIVGKLMQPFFTTKEVGKGTGLGLSIARGIAEKHHGTLELDVSSKNTRFVLKLPQAPASTNSEKKGA